MRSRMTAASGMPAMTRRQAPLSQTRSCQVEDDALTAMSTESDDLGGMLTSQA